jgi:hypothetical protein
MTFSLCLSLSTLDKALMPAGDHLNIIDPPGLTVMRIAGGRYRVTGAHRVVWTWMNEFASISEDGSDLDAGSPEKLGQPKLQMEDLVSLIIVDVFETDNQGKLLSYCPTFDNRAVQKTNQTAETFRKSSSKLFSMLGRAQKAVAKSEVNKKATAQLSKMGIVKHAKNVAENVIHRVDEAVHNYNSPSRKTSQTQGAEPVTDLQGFEEAITAAEEAATADSPASENRPPPQSSEETKDIPPDDETEQIEGKAEI